jgi:hypothetical protein
VERRLFAVREGARAFVDNFGADARPVEFGRVLFARDTDLVRTDDEGGVAFRANVERENAVDGVVLEEMGRRLNVAQLVDGGDLETVVLKSETRNFATDAAETVNGNFDGGFHGLVLSTSGKECQHSMRCV